MHTNHTNHTNQAPLRTTTRGFQWPSAKLWALIAASTLMPYLLAAILVVM